MRYVYTGSETAAALAKHFDGVEQRRGHLCDPVRRADGRVVRCTDAGISNAAVRFEDGTVSTVSPRRLRLVKKLPRVYLVACSKRKQESLRAHPAKELYTGDLFRKSRAYVERQCILDGRWFILSAYYWLLRPDELAWRYDESLNAKSADQRRRWASLTADLLLGSHVEERTHFVVLAGKKYREHLIPRLRAEGHPCSVPMRGLGIGQQKAWLKKRVR